MTGISGYGSGYVGSPGFGIQSTGNTTTSTTTSYTGTGEQNPFPDVMVSCFSDTVGTLYFDFSVNGSDWRTFPSNGFAVTASVHEFHTAVKGPRYFRARWSSSSTPGTLQIYTYYGVYRQPNAPLNQAHGLDSDAILTRPTLPWMDISRSLITGMSVVKKFGRNAAVGTTYTPITFGGDYNMPQAASATTLRIKAGGDANDTAAGTGAREVTLVGLDETWADASEAVATAGATASSVTTTTFTRLHRAYVSAAGTYATTGTGSHVADIVIENGGGGTDWATIDSTDYPKSQSEIAFYAIPTGYTAYIFPKEITVDTTKTTDIIFVWRGGADETAAPYTAIRTQSVVIGLVDNYQFSKSDTPLGPYAGPADIGFMGKVDVGTASIAVEFDIYLVNE